MSSIKDILGSQKTTWVKTVTPQTDVFTEARNTNYQKRSYIKVDYDVYDGMMDSLSKGALTVARKMLLRVDHYTNIFLGTYTEIREMTNLSKTSVENAMAELLSVDFIRKKKNGRWMINPTVAIGCDDKFFDSLMNQYYNLDFGQPKRAQKKGEEKNVT